MNTSPGLYSASVRTFLLCLLAALATTACGQRGPLYLPQSEPRPAPPSEPATQPQSGPETQPGDPADEDPAEESGEEV